MNVLLIFANLAILLNVLKDFMDTEWKWKNKNLINIVLLELSLIPTVFNVYNFITSDLPLKKVFFFNLTKALTMDYFDKFLTNCCITGEIKIFNLHICDWFFCNPATGSLGEFHGGEVLYFRPGNVTRNLYEKLDVYPIVYYLAEFSNIINCDDDKLDDLPLIARADMKYAISRREASIFKNHFLGKGFFKDCEIIKCTGNFFAIKKGGSYLLKNFSCLLYNSSLSILGVKVSYSDLGIVDFNEILQHLPHPVQLDFNVGNLKFSKEQNHSLIVSRSDGRKKRVLNDKLSIEESVTAHVVLSFWSENPSLGITEHNLNVHEDGFCRHPIRKDVEIMHCLSLTNLASAIRSKNNFYFSKVGPQKYYIEGIDVKAKLTQMTDELFLDKLGEGNYRIFNGLLRNCLNTEERANDFQLYGLKNMLLELKSSINISTRLAFEGYKIKNYHLKKLLVDVNYFFGLIKYGEIRFTDKKIPVTRFAADLCRKHVILSLPRPEFKSAECLEKIRKRVLRENKMYIFKKSRNLEKLELDYRLARCAERNAVKIDIKKSFKDILLSAINNNDDQEKRISAKIGLGIIDKYDHSKKDTNLVKRENKKKYEYKSCEIIYDDPPKFNESSSQNKNKNKNKDGNKLWKEVSNNNSVGMKVVFRSKAEKLMRTLNDENSESYNPSYFKVLWDLGQDDLSYVKKSSICSSKVLDSIKLATDRKKEIKMMAMQENLTKDLINKEIKEFKIREAEKSASEALALKKRKDNIKEERLKKIKVSGGFCEPCDPKLLPKKEGIVYKGFSKKIYEEFHKTGLGLEFSNSYTVIPKILLIMRNINDMLVSGRLIPVSYIKNLESTFNQYIGECKREKQKDKLTLMHNEMRRILLSHDLCDPE